MPVLFFDIGQTLATARLDANTQNWQMVRALAGGALVLSATFVFGLYLS
jgi:hypothetical protein